MAAKLMISRTDHTPAMPRERACRDKVRDGRNRLRALALVSEDELPRAGIAVRAGVGVQTLCDWVKRYIVHGVDGLRDAARPGRPPMLDTDPVATVASWLEGGTDPGADEPSRRTVADIRQRIMDTFGVWYTIEGVRQMMRRLGFRPVSPRPVHPRADPVAQEEFRSHFNPLVEAAVPDDVSSPDVLVGFQDEAGMGQKGMLWRVWARKGTRPRIVRDPRYGDVCLFSAAGPENGAAVGQVGPKANPEEMNRHLRDLAEQVPTGKHALVVLDRAGWHRSKNLAVPKNVSLLRLPPCSPELNPIGTLFPVLKHRHFANRVFDSTEQVRQTVEHVWNGFVRMKDEIRQITARQWAVP